MDQYRSIFASPSGEETTLSAYDAVVRRWPVAHTELDIPTSFGTTHVHLVGNSVRSFIAAVAQPELVNGRLLEALSGRERRQPLREAL